MSGFVLATLGFVGAMGVPALLVAAAESTAWSSARALRAANPVRRSLGDAMRTYRVH